MNKNYIKFIIIFTIVLFIEINLLFIIDSEIVLKNNNNYQKSTGLDFILSNLKKPFVTNRYNNSTINSDSIKIKNLYNSINNIKDEFEIVSYSFCLEKNCSEKFVDLIKENSYCTFYDLRDIHLIQELSKNNNEVLLDYRNEEKFLKYIEKNNIDFIKKNNSIEINKLIIYIIKYSYLMHNKFCVINETIITGSYNPTINENENNIVILESKKISKIYLLYYYLIKYNLYKYKEEKRKVITYEKNITICFSPFNNCQKDFFNTINKTKKEINFAIFSLNEKEIINLLVNLSNNNIIIRGILERTLAGQKTSINKRLINITNNINLFLDNSKSFMHHKFIVIDDNILITGSQNPSSSGFKNYENSLIIEFKEEEEIIKDYKNEVNRIIEKSIK